jgi:hypothetical protein
MPERASLVALLRNWEHPRRWEDRIATDKSAVEALLLAKDIEKDLALAPSPELERQRREVQELFEHFVTKSSTMHHELSDLRKQLEAQEPRLIRHFPAVDPVADCYLPEQRAEMVRVILAELLAATPQYVTLADLRIYPGASKSKQKRWKARKNNPMPSPAIEGGGRQSCPLDLGRPAPLARSRNWKAATRTLPIAR